MDASIHFQRAFVEFLEAEVSAREIYDHMQNVDGTVYATQINIPIVIFL